MELYTPLVASVLFPLHERLKGHSTVAMRRNLERTQWWSKGALEILQVMRLRTMLKDVSEHVPYYRELFAAAHFDPESVGSVVDLQGLPCLTKPIIRARSQDLRHARAHHLSKSSTGGSSGEPLIFLIGKDRVSHDVAARWRAKRWWDVDVGDREIVLWGSPIELRAQDRIRLARDAVLRSQLLSAFDLSEPSLDRFVQRIRDFKPASLFGYPYSMAHLARHAEKRRVPLNDLGIKVVFVTSEQLYDDQRADIERVFGCPVANEYGGRDAGLIAHECPSGGMHLSAEDIVVEILDANGRQVPVGQPGEVTVTHLASREFPFIRYRTGDIAVLDGRQCPCGRGLPLLGEIQGRSNDFLKALDGTPIPCKAFTYLLREVPGIESFKVVQESVASTRLMIVTGDGFDPAVMPTIVTGFRRRLGEAVHIEIDRVREIPKDTSGKFRYVVSHVS
jgi:phenylacetate-CoA ligase